MNSAASVHSLQHGGNRGSNPRWDAKVRELCNKDGGVTVYERIRLSESEYRRLRDLGRSIAPVKDLAPYESPYISEQTCEVLRKGVPAVYRVETSVVRRSDGKILSRSVNYFRQRDGFISGFGCRDVDVPVDITGATFEIVEDPR